MDEGSKGKSSMKTIPEEAQILDLLDKDVHQMLHFEYMSRAKGNHAQRIKRNHKTYRGEMAME